MIHFALKITLSEHACKLQFLICTICTVYAMFEIILLKKVIAKLQTAVQLRSPWKNGRKVPRSKMTQNEPPKWHVIISHRTPFQEVPRHSTVRPQKTQHRLELFIIHSHKKRQPTDKTWWDKCTFVVERCVVWIACNQFISVEPVSIVIGQPC